MTTSTDGLSDMDAALGQVDEYERFQRHLEAALGDEERVERHSVEEVQEDG